MALIRTRAAGDQYYDDAPRPYVGVPIKERMALGKSKEDQYLVAKDQLNELETLKRNLPKDYSSDVYNNLIAETNKFTSQITPDNYTDNILDVKQFANDFANKLGGKELIEEAAQISAASAVLDEAYKKGEIVDPEMLNYKKKQLMTNRKPLTYDENGYVTKTNVKAPTVAPYVDGQQFLIDQMKGWEASGDVVRNADGTIKVTGDLAGYLGVDKETYVTEEELRKGAYQALQANDKYQAYLEDYADMKTSNIQDDQVAITLNASLSPEQKEKLFGTKDANELDIQSAISNGRLDGKQAIKELVKAGEVQEKGDFSVNKYSFSRKDNQQYKNDILFKALETQMEMSKIKADEQNNVLVSTNTFTTNPELSPNDVLEMDKKIDELKEKRTNVQKALNNYKRAREADIKAGKTNSRYTEDEIQRQNRAVAKLDNELANIEYNKSSVRKNLDDKLRNSGIDLDKAYVDESLVNRNQVIKDNSAILVSNEGPNRVATGRNIDIDVSKNIITKDGKQYIKSTELNSAKQELIPISNYRIEKKDGKTILKLNSLSPNVDKVLTGLSDIVFDSDGRLTNNVEVDDKIKSELYRVPTIQEYKDLALDIYNRGESSREGLGLGLSERKKYVNEKNKLMVSGNLLKTMEGFREKNPNLTWQTQKDMSYITTEGETTKSNIVAYRNLENQFDKDFKATPEQYSVYDDASEEGTVGLMTHLQEKYNLKSGDIDWEKTNAKIALQTDREFGQKALLFIIPKKEWIDDNESDAKKLFNNTNSLKIVAINKSPGQVERAQEIQQVLMNTYTDIRNDTSAHAINNKKDMGVMYFDNSEAGKEFNNKNLYVMAAGEIQPIKIPNGNGGLEEFRVTTTAKTAESTDLLNVNFHLNKIQGNTEYTLATNGKESKWMSLAETNKPKDEWVQTVFETPTDIKAIIGGSLMENEFANKQTQQPENVYSKFMQSSSYNVTNGNVTSTTKRKVVTQTKNTYSKSNVISVLDGTGREVKINSRVPKSDLVDISSLYAGRIKNVKYPLVNKAVVPHVSRLMNDYDLMIQGGFRPDEGLGLSNEQSNSMHKYGAGLDFDITDRSKQLFAELQNNPAKAKEYGIIHIADEKDHYHVEFTLGQI